MGVMDWTFYKNVLNTIFFFLPQKVIPIFLHILSTPLYTIAITQAASLCPIQKKSVVAHPAITAQKL
jgi:hypothetical protein